MKLVITIHTEQKVELSDVPKNTPYEVVKAMALKCVQNFDPKQAKHQVCWEWSDK